MAAYITVGAKTSHGGTVISGSPHTTHNGIPVARKGDKVICKKCKKVTTILSGDASFIIDGAPIARGGDVTSCGAKLIASQQSFSESGFDVGSIAQAAPLVFPKSDPDALFENKLASTQGLYIDLKGNKNTVYDGGIDGSKFSVFGKDCIQAFNEIKSTPQGQHIISVIQNDSSIYRVSIETVNSGGLGLTTIKKEPMILNRHESWKLWESDEMIDKDMITVKINMNVDDPYFVRADSKSTDGKATGVFKPTLTRVMAHELGHIKNYVDTGKTDYKHKAITYENTIMRELDDNSILRHPSARHGGGFAK